jgi:hypothetical protein
MFGSTSPLDQRRRESVHRQAARAHQDCAEAQDILAAYMTKLNLPARAAHHRQEAERQRQAAVEQLLLADRYRPDRFAVLTTTSTTTTSAPVIVERRRPHGRDSL